MSNKVLITTTQNIEQFEIENYLEIISTNVVIGTNFFSDFGASITDFFGGISGTYQNKLQEIYDVAIDNLRKKAKRKGANAVIGLKIDFDEISGKGKSMFMISAIGTAVVVKQKTKNVDGDISKNISDSAISNIELNNEVTRILIIEKTNRKILPTKEDWTYLLNYPLEEITELLLDNYIVINPKEVDKLPEDQILLFENFPSYIQILNKNYTINLLYDKIEGESNLIIDMIRKNNLFNSEKIQHLIRKGFLSSAIECLKINKENYVQGDISEMHEIISLLDGLPDVGKIETTKGLLSKSTEVYVCPKGHKNNIVGTFCQHQNNEHRYDCKLNIKNITENQTKEIKVFKLKVKTLDKMLNNKG